MDCLNLNNGHDLMAHVSPEKSDSASAFPIFSYQWSKSGVATTTKIEALSYQPFLNYLRTNKYERICDLRWAGTSEWSFFDINIHLKSDFTLKSKDLRLRGAEPRCKFHLSGRSDLVILTPGNRVISRQTVAIFDNGTISASVLLINLAKTHYALCLEEINVTKKVYKQIAMVVLLKDRQYFGSPPIPECSELESGSADDVNTDFSNVKLSAEDCITKLNEISESPDFLCLIVM